MTARVEDWPERLLAFVESRRDAAFAWGQNDCCTFAADAVMAIAGADPMAAYRDGYDSALGAARRIREAGYADLAAAVDAVLPAIAPLTAQRGDVVMFEAIDGPALGVVMGVYAAAAGPAGVTWVECSRWVRAWRVGGSE